VNENEVARSGGPSAPRAGDERWTRELLEKLATDSLVERRRARRWSIFFRLVYLLLFLVGGLVVLGTAGGGLGVGGPHAAVIDIRGTIEEGGSNSAERINDALLSAFESDATRGVILRINSPGGSAVQAGQIYDEIRRLRAKHPGKPLFAVIEEVGASGAYYVAAAADRIYADKASLVGSIGVLIDGFGFTGAMEKLGVERRLLTAGANKGFLDPFSPQDETDRLHAQRLLDTIHQQFIAAVREGRGERLRDQPELFTGLVWTGTRAAELGLVDAMGTVTSVARDELGADAIVDYTPRESVAERLARQVGAQLAAKLGAMLESAFDAGASARLR
jgi:protease-4